MNKLVINCPPGAVSVMDGRLEGHFLLFILTGSPVIYLFPYDNFKFCRGWKGWWGFSSQGVVMASVHLPQEMSGMNLLSTEPGLRGPLKGLEE